MERIAIVDDDEVTAETSRWDVEGAGFEPVIIANTSFSDFDGLVKTLIVEADGAVCDHRLAPRGYASFKGSELVARLYEEKMPAILITQFLQDSDVSIRMYRDRIPVLLPRDQASAEAVAEGLRYCQAEINGEYSEKRKPARTLLEIVAITEEAGETVCDAFAIGWNPHISIRFPMSLIPSELQGLATEGKSLFAKVNIGATRVEDIYLSGFEPAPQPAEDV